MGMMQRFMVLIGASIANAAAGILFVTTVQPLLDIAGPGGSSSGFLSSTVEQIGVVGPLVIAVLQLAIVIWFIVTSVQEERNVRPRRAR
jgi:hypothetical protein